MSVGAVNTYTFDNIAADHTIDATFAVDAFAITASANANGIITPAGHTDVAYGGSQTYTFAADQGFHISEIFIDGQSIGASEGYTFLNVMEEHTIAVNFSENIAVNIWIEAEDGNMQWPMEIGDDAAGHVAAKFFDLSWHLFLSLRGRAFRVAAPDTS